MMNMSAIADVFRELPCRICEFLFLKLPCYMKRVRKSKELELSLLTFTCSKSTIETLGKGVKYVQS